MSNIQIRGDMLPYITSDIRKLIRQRDYLRGKANKTGSHILRQAFKHMKMKVNYAIRDARRKYYIKKIDENEGNLKQTWKVLNHAMNRKCKTSNIGKLCIEKREICDPGDIAESLNDHFVSIGKKLAKEIPVTEDPQLLILMN